MGASVFDIPFQWQQPSTWPWMIWVWIVFLVAGWSASLWKRYQRSRATSWPIADARIESAEVRKPGSSFTSKRGYYTAEVGYSYAVGGSRYSGLYTRQLPSEREADEFLRDLKGKSVPAHYRAENPSRSALLEPDVETLLQTRAPSENNDLTVVNSVVPNWAAPFLWLFIGIAATGLALSLWVHIGAVRGQRVAPEKWFFALHLGIFLVWIPTVFIAQRVVGNPGRKDFWKVGLRNCPPWMKYMVYGFFGYAAFNFLLFMAKAPSGKGDANPPAGVWRGFSGHWMAFYSAALGILYSAAVAVRSTFRCPNGHVISADSPTYCARCGRAVGRDR